MIVSPDQTVLDVPANVVAHIMIVEKRNAAGKVKRSSTLLNVPEKSLLASPQTFGMPNYWCRRSDNKIGIWPVPDKEYELEFMGGAGQILNSNRSAPVNNNQPYIEAFAQAQRNNELARARQLEIKPERFTLGNEE
jgi:hypothetical protein